MKLLIVLSVFISFYLSTAEQPKIVVLVGFDENDVVDRIFQGDNNFWAYLRYACAQKGYLLTTQRSHMQEPYALVTFNHPHTVDVANFKAQKKILYTWEPPTLVPTNFNSAVHSMYSQVMTWDDSLIDNKKYCKFNYALQFSSSPHVIPFADKKLCALFAGNKISTHPRELYSKRRELISFFETYAPQDLGLYGAGWLGKSLRTYRGYAPDKIECMKYYKFVIAYENMHDIKGYITEKIFDAFSAGSVPVYWGASNIAAYIPQNCFINREHFESDVHLYAFLMTMPESYYNYYLDNIKNFLQSSKAYAFTCQNFITTFIEALDY